MAKEGSLGIIQLETVWFGQREKCFFSKELLLWDYRDFRLCNNSFQFITLIFLVLFYSHISLYLICYLSLPTVCCTSYQVFYLSINVRYYVKQPKCSN